MPRSRRYSAAIALLLVSILGFLTFLPRANAQRGFQPRPVVPNPSGLQKPASNQVYQRGRDGKADVMVALPESAKNLRIVDASINGQIGSASSSQQPVKFVDGKLIGVPTGGPYTVSCQVTNPSDTVNTRGRMVVTSGPFFVGDLWVLAGQSNMEGVGDLIDVTPPNPKVMLLGMDGKWTQAEEPLHWLVDSPDPVHSGDPSTRADRAAKTHGSRAKGAGLGLPFAAALTEATGIPIGLVACAHGGTSMGQWDPAKKNEGGNSLYGSMIRQVQLAGGKVKGVLWYQGESDAMGSPETWKAFPKVFATFISAVRQDFAEPELPFYYVQLGRFVKGANPQGWNTVRDAQRLLTERVPNTAVISVLDLELDDGIHVGTKGLERAGHRLAQIAQRELFGLVGATTPTLGTVYKTSPRTLVVKFKGVNMGSTSPAINGRRVGMARTGMMGQPSPGSTGVGLQPEHHIAGFSIRHEDGTDAPLIYEAMIGQAKDTVILKLDAAIPPKCSLYYAYGLDPYCNLVDGLDMAALGFGPISLDDLDSTVVATPTSQPAATPPKATMAAATAPKSVATTTTKPTINKPLTASTSLATPTAKKPVKLLIITGDAGSYHPWKVITAALESTLAKSGRFDVHVTTTPSNDLTLENLAKYEVLLLNYKDTPEGAPASRWSDANKAAFLKAVNDGKGLVLIHHSSSSFTKPNWVEFEKAVAGGWRTQGFHGPAHPFTVKKTAVKHPISSGLPGQFNHVIDELYQNCMLLPGTEVLATAYSDPAKPKGTGKDEAVIWVNHYGKGRVYENVLGHDAAAISDPNFQSWLTRGALWAATGKVD